MHLKGFHSVFLFQLQSIISFKTLNMLRWSIVKRLLEILKKKGLKETNRTKMNFVALHFFFIHIIFEQVLPLFSIIPK